MTRHKEQQPSRGGPIKPQPISGRTSVVPIDERFRLMAEALPQMIFTMTADGSIDYMNPQWSVYLGQPAQPLFRNQSAWQQIIHYDDWPVTIAKWFDRLGAGLAFEHVYRLRRHDGEYRWHNCKVMPMRGLDGRVNLWVGSCTDIDDIQQAVRQQHDLELKAAVLKAQHSRLVALNKAKDDFISLASHQLRTPATGVKQYLAMLMQGFAGPMSTEQQAFVQTAYESNERQINIVNDLLRVAQIDAGKLRLVRRKTDLIRLVKSVVSEHMAAVSARQQTIRLVAPLDKLLATVDARQVRSVLDSIIDNASKYSPPHKTITVSLGQAVDARTGRFVAAVAIRDQGGGMTANETKQIFQKFSRLANPVTRTVDGSGLGLYWARTIANLHGGDIVVRSRRGRGTTFTVTLPLDEQAGKPAASQSVKT